MIGWLIAAVLIVILLLTKVGVRIRWDSGTALLKLRIGRLRFTLSTEKKEKKPDGKPKKKQKSAGEPKQKPAMKKWISALLHHWQDVLRLIGRVLRMPKLDLLRVRITAGGADGEACAMNYGRYCAILGAVLPAVEHIFSVKKQDVKVACQFEKEKTEIFAEVETTVKIYEVIALLGACIGLLIKLYYFTKKSKKAVQIS